jgi:hypothetical protein
MFFNHKDVYRKWNRWIGLENNPRDMATLRPKYWDTARFGYAAMIAQVKLNKSE